MPVGVPLAEVTVLVRVTDWPGFNIVKPAAMVAAGVALVTVSEAARMRFLP
jgi:hypothetical protein